jgi:tRNA (guanine-N7-)-methyltransferase
MRRNGCPTRECSSSAERGCFVYGRSPNGAPPVSADRPLSPRSPSPRPYADAPRLVLQPTMIRVPVPFASLVAGSSYELEIGPGRGGFILERALAKPEVGLVGLAVRRKWASIVDARLRAASLAPRARVFAEDVKEALPRLTPDGCLERVYLHFPDPWWKKRHEKRLVMELPVLDQIARLLAPEGELFIQTDVSERADQYESLIGADARFSPFGDPSGTGARLTENPYEAQSPRERRAVIDGLPIYRIRFRRK